MEQHHSAVWRNPALSLTKLELMKRILLYLLALVVTGAIPGSTGFAQHTSTNGASKGVVEAKPERVWGAETNGLQLSMSLNKTNYSVGEPVWAKMIIRNSGLKVKRVQETLQISDFKFTILDASGNPVPLTPYGKEWESRPLISHWNTERELKLGDQLKNEHRLDQIWDMSQPGKYRITAIRPVSLDNWMELKTKGVPLKERFAYVTSNTVEMEVVASNAEPPK